MNRRTHAIQRITSIALSLVVAFYSSTVPFLQAPRAYAIEKPQAPSAPTAPEAPTAPDSPEAPEAPEAPKNPREETEEDTSETATDSSNDSETNTQNEESTPKETTQPTPTPTTTPQAIQETTQSPTSTEANNSTQNSGDKVGDSEIDTGDATSIVNAGTVVNTNTATDKPQSGGDNVDLTNSSNASDSTNNNSVDLSNKKDTVQVNKAGVDNGVDAESVTGNNNNSRNVGSSTTNTGDANTSATVITTANTNAQGVEANEFNIVDDHVGDIILDANNPCSGGCQMGEVVVLKNGGNGSGSNNNNDVTVEETRNTFQDNDADIQNDIILSADSGNNTSKDNTGGNTEITTGDANVAANVVNIANTNVAGALVINTVNIFGDLVGDIIAPEASDSNSCTSECGDGSGDVAATNSGNGTNSSNANEFTSSTEDLLIQDNKATINNTLSVDTNTGNNNLSDNTGGDVEATTGKSNVDVNVVNVANQNVSNGEWWIVLVNQAGQWVGQIMGAPEGATMAGSDGTQFTVNDDGSIQIANSGNGSNSDNNNSVAQKESTTTVQTNNANVTNNLQLSANTGNNDASRNTGGTSEITTGDTNIVANLVNFVNNNISGGGKINVTVINVIGTWIGDFVSPGHQKAQKSSQTEEVAQNQEEARGGYVAETETTKTVETKETETQNSIATTTVQETSALLAQAESNANVGFTGFSVGGKVLGQATQEESIDKDSDSEEVFVTSETTSDVKKPIKVKVTWPALITSLLGLVYAGLRARGLMAV